MTPVQTIEPCQAPTVPTVESDPAHTVEPRRAPAVRTCVGCRRREPADGLVRFVWSETAGAVVRQPPHGHRGRGAWLHARSSCAALAIQRRAFGRALRRPVGPVALGEVERIAATWRS